MDETETDLEILLECLKCQKKDAAGMKRSLLALASLFSSNGEAKEYFRQLGGLQLVQQLLCMETASSLLQAVMFCLACAIEKDVFCQNTLTKPEIFNFLHKIFSQKRSEKKSVHAAVFLLLNLVDGNSTGQQLAKESSTLSDLLEIFRHCAKKCQMRKGEFEEDLEIWSSVVTALSLCVNNPQNEMNQRLSSTLLPLCFQFLTKNQWRQLSGSLLSFIGLTVAGNGSNQNRVRNCGGLDALLQLARKFDREAQTDDTKLHTAVAIINVTNACIADNIENARYFVSNGGLEIVISILSQPVQHSPQDLLQLTLTLGQALEFADKDTTPLNVKNQGILVQLLTETEDEEVVRAIKYVLNTWQKHAGKDDPEAENTLKELATSTQRIKQLSLELGLSGHNSLHIDKNNLLGGSEYENNVREPAHKQLPVDDLPSPEAFTQQLHSLAGDTNLRLENLALKAKSAHQVHQSTAQHIEQRAFSPGPPKSVHPLYLHKSSQPDKMQASHVQLSLPASLPAVAACSSLTQPQPLFSLNQPSHTETLLHSSLESEHVLPSAESHHLQTLPLRQASQSGEVALSLQPPQADPFLSPPESAQTHAAEHLQPIFQCRSASHVQNAALSNSCHEQDNKPAESCETQEQKEWMAFNYFRRFLSTFLNVDSFSGHAVNVTSGQSYMLAEERVDLTDNENDRCSGVRESMSLQRFNLDVKNNVSKVYEQVSCTSASPKSKKENLTFPKNKECVAQPESVPLNLSRKQETSSHCQHDADHARLNSLQTRRYCCPGWLQKLHSSHEEQVFPFHTETECRDTTISPSLCGQSQTQRCRHPVQQIPAVDCMLEHFTGNLTDCVQQRNKSDDENSQNISVDRNTLHTKVNNCTDDANTENIGKNTFKPTGLYTDDADFSHRPNLVYESVGPAATDAANLPITEHYSRKLNTDNSQKLSHAEKFLSPRSMHFPADYESERLSGTKESRSAENVIQDYEFRVPLPKQLVGIVAHSSRPAKLSVKEMPNEFRRGQSAVKKCLRRAPSKTSAASHNHFAQKIVHTPRPSENRLSFRKEFEATKLPCTDPLGEQFAFKDSDRKTHLKGVQQTSSGKYCPDFVSSLNDSCHVIPPSPAASVFDVNLLNAASSSVCLSQTSIAENPHHIESQATTTSICSTVQRSELMSVSNWLSGTTLHRGNLVDCSNETIPHANSGHDCTSFKQIPGRAGDFCPESEVDSLSASQSSSCMSEVYSVLKVSPHLQYTLRAENDTDNCGLNLCPGCTSVDLLNSLTYNIALETNSSTCSAHRRIRQIERDFILTTTSQNHLQKKLGYRKWKEKTLSSKLTVAPDHQCKKKKVQPSDIYDLTSGDSDNMMVSPPNFEHTLFDGLKNTINRECHLRKKRQRVPYTEEEESNLVKGVQKMGKHWQQLLNSFPFHPSRTAVDLMEKYKRMQKQRERKRVIRRCRKPSLSMCEERRLRRGVAQFGHNWTTILKSGRFAPCRTAEELRDLWRVMNKLH